VETGDHIRLLTVIVLFYTFDVGKLGIEKQFTSKSENLADSAATLRPTAQGRTKRA
jgi:hypothetical protein